MPELAEVDYYRRQWDPGIGSKITAVSAHWRSRVFRDSRRRLTSQVLVEATLVRSQSHGKQMLFQFTKDLWLRVHLGMTGGLRVEPAGYLPGRHDHLVLAQRNQCLVFSDPRQFGRVRLDREPTFPVWWRTLPPSILTREFTLEWMSEFLDRHRKYPIKAALLHQEGFPGIGNWMADEILWRSRLRPDRISGRLPSDERRRLWQALRFVARGAMRSIAPAFADPPRSWFYHARWTDGNPCPTHGIILKRGTVGGRTTAWCPLCQR